MCSRVSTFSCHLSREYHKLKHQNTPTGTSEGTCTSCTGLQVNEYFTDTGGLTDSCPKQDCDTSRCNAGEYLSGCAGVSDGTCVPCTGLATNHYWTSNGGVTDSCQSAACETNCGTGRYRHDCGEAYEGYCESCTGKPENTFYVSDGGLTDSCEHTDCSTDTCNPGYYRDMCGANANTSHPGTCTQCEENCGSGSYRTQCGALYEGHCTYCENNCVPGQYRKNCEGITQGNCEDCTNKPNNTYYVSSGNLTNSCQFESCEANCPDGFYRKNCDGTNPGYCHACLDDCGAGKYRDNCGALFEGTCRNCESCAIGYTRTNCGNTNSGTCEESPCLDAPDVRFSTLATALGQCANTQSGENCTYECIDGYTPSGTLLCYKGTWSDVFCSENDECQELEPCSNGATCEDMVNGYACHCKCSSAKRENIYFLILHLLTRITYITH